jgi:hypothetical protein
MYVVGVRRVPHLGKETVEGEPAVAGAESATPGLDDRGAAKAGDVLEFGGGGPRVAAGAVHGWGGRWRMDDGRWRMEDGRWRMEDGRWRMEDGGQRWEMTKDE